MKIKDIEKKSAKDLEALLYEKKTALRKFRFGVAGSKVKDLSEGKKVKADIARIVQIMESKK